MKKTIVTCDVIGCYQDGYKEVDCCRGYMLEDDLGKYEMFEKPLEAKKTDLCHKHWKEWSKLTCKFLKMDKEKAK